MTAVPVPPAPGVSAFLARFVRTEAAGGVTLVVAAAVALIWANSPWSSGYASLFDEDLRHVVNDGFMTLFFFVVGLEIKREWTDGELSDRRVAALPIAAAIGGMVVPVLIFFAINGGGPGGRGWGIPMATDIAFALGVLALLGSRVPPTLKLFLLTLAIVDDVGAIAVIAVFYSSDIDVAALAAAVGGVAVFASLHRVRADRAPIYAALALATWYVTYRSGVHATIAGVALALALPTRLGTSDDSSRVSPTEQLEKLLHPVTSFLVLPAFALANAGVRLRSDVLSGAGAGRLAAAIAVALVLGKFVGVMGGAWLAVRLRIATVPSDTRWPHLAGAAALAGIGFTVSLFITGLAFEDPALGEAAKLAILVGSLISAVAGTGILLRVRADRVVGGAQVASGPRTGQSPPE